MHEPIEVTLDYASIGVNAHRELMLSECGIFPHAKLNHTKCKLIFSPMQNRNTKVLTHFWNPHCDVHKCHGRV